LLLVCAPAVAAEESLFAASGESRACSLALQPGATAAAYDEFAEDYDSLNEGGVADALGARP